MVHTVPRFVFWKSCMNGTIIMLWLIGALAFAHTGMQESKKGGDGMTPKKTVSEVLRQHTDSLMAILGVVGTGEGAYRGKPCILVFVEKKSTTLMKKIPKTLEGFAVVVRKVGKVKPLR